MIDMTDLYLILILVGTFMFPALFLRGLGENDDYGEFRLPNLKSAVRFLLWVFAQAIVIGFMAERFVAMLGYELLSGCFIAIVVAISGQSWGWVMFKNMAEYHAFTQAERLARQKVDKRKSAVG